VRIYKLPKVLLELEFTVLSDSESEGSVSKKALQERLTGYNLSFGTSRMSKPELIEELMTYSQSREKWTGQFKPRRNKSRGTRKGTVAERTKKQFPGVLSRSQQELNLHRSKRTKHGYPEGDETSMKMEISDSTQHNSFVEARQRRTEEQDAWVTVKSLYIPAINYIVLIFIFY
jgi:hypothetical protein